MSPDGPPGGAGPAYPGQDPHGGLNFKKEGAGKISSQDFGNEVYAANRALNQANMARSRKHASEGSGSILSMDSASGGGGGGGPPSHLSASPSYGASQAPYGYTEPQQAPQQEAGSKTYVARKKEADRGADKVGASGAFDPSVYLNSRSTNTDSKNAVAERNRGSSNLLSN